MPRMGLLLMLLLMRLLHIYTVEPSCIKIPRSQLRRVSDHVHTTTTKRNYFLLPLWFVHSSIASTTVSWLDRRSICGRHHHPRYWPYTPDHLLLYAGRNTWSGSLLVMWRAQFVGSTSLQNKGIIFWHNLLSRRSISTWFPLVIRRIRASTD